MGVGPHPARTTWLIVLKEEDLYAIRVQFEIGRLDPYVIFLDRNFKVLEKLSPVKWKRELLSSQTSPIFLRGDVNGDGTVGFQDALFLLQMLLEKTPFTSCPDSADANDDGRLTISDAVTILRKLFYQGSLQASCSADETPDDLPPCSYDLWNCFKDLEDR